MLVNGDALSVWVTRTSGRCFDRQGVLSVRRSDHGLFWRQSAARKLVVLKGNLLFVIDEQSPRDQQAVELLLVLVDFRVTIGEQCDEGCTSYAFVIEFADDLFRPVTFSSTSITDRDAWVQAIHLSSPAYLRAIKQTFEQLVAARPQVRPMSSPPPGADVLECTLAVQVTVASDVAPNICASLYRKDQELGLLEHVDSTEVAGHARETTFAKVFTLPVSDLIHGLKAKVYDVIEVVTDTKLLLGECDVQLDQFGSETSFKLLATHFDRFDEPEVVGELTIAPVRKDNNELIARPRSLTIQAIKSNYEQTTPDNGRRSSSSSTSSGCGSLSQVTQRMDEPEATSVSCSPNYSQIDSRQFVNCVERSFQFDVQSGRTLVVHEVMAEAAYCLQIPQLIM